MFGKAILNIYSLLNLGRLAFFNFILPNFFSKNIISYCTVPLCNQRLLMTGRGKIEIGGGCSFGYKLGGRFNGGYIEIQPRSKSSLIKIGNSVSCNNNLFICSEGSITIGNNTLIGENVTMLDFDGHGVNSAERHSLGDVGKIIIGENVWIGNDVRILKNTSIGRNSIVATGAVVKGVFPDNVLLGGVPAKVIKNIS